jgi:phosphohistidine phosphatase
MSRLMLLRHAKTASAEPGENDRDRKLTARGRSDAPIIGAYMAQHRLVPDLALVSPATRAWETWELVAGALGANDLAAKPRLVKDERIYNASPRRLSILIRETRNAATILLVGHNPGLHELAMSLIASGDVNARERLLEKLPTCGLVVIDLPFDDWPELHANSGRLERFVTHGLIAASATE